MFIRSVCVKSLALCLLWCRMGTAPFSAFASMSTLIPCYAVFTPSIRLWQHPTPWSHWPLARWQCTEPIHLPITVTDVWRKHTLLRSERICRKSRRNHWRLCAVYTRFNSIQFDLVDLVLGGGCLPGGCLPGGGVCPGGEVSAAWGRCLPGGAGVCPRGVYQTPPQPPWTEWQTCKNITLPQLRCGR